MEMSNAPVVITVAPVGAEVTREQHPGVPFTPTEIAAETAGAVSAGAAAVHLHVRNDDGAPSGDTARFRETIDAVRAACDVVTMVSTGGALDMSRDERASGLDAGPDVAGVETGSVNFGGDEVFVTSDADSLRFIEHARRRGLAIELELFDVGHAVRAAALLADGIVPGLPRVNLVFGVPGGIDATADGLAAMLRPLPADAHWSVTAIGRHQWPMLELALAAGAGGVRVGFEDNVRITRDRRATSNADLVRHAGGLIAAAGRRVATVAEARAVLVGGSGR